MALTNDTLATILGGGAAALSAGQVAVGQLQPEATMHSGDWLQLGFALLMAAFGWVANRQKKPV